MSHKNFPWTYVVLNWSDIIGVYSSAAHCVALIRFVTATWSSDWKLDLPKGTFSVYRFRPAFGCSDSLELDREDITEIVLKAV